MRLVGVGCSPPLPSLLSQPRHAPWGPSGSKGSGGGRCGYCLFGFIGWAWRAGAVEVALGKSDKRRSVVRSASEHTVGLISRLSNVSLCFVLFFLYVRVFRLVLN